MLKGALHVHSTYSDGELTLAELRNVYAAAGCRFACVTDHADAFDEASLRRYVEECAARSDETFRFIAGLEFTCTDRMHVIGYGVTTLVAATDPADVVRHIERCGGVSVVAHPQEAHFDRIDTCEAMPHGIEVWNSKYDGRYAPRSGPFDLLRRMQRRCPDLRAFYGQDLHWRTQYRGLFVHVDADGTDRAGILAALRAGAYVGEKNGLRLPSDGVLPQSLARRMDRAHRRSDRVRAALRVVKRLADRAGVRVPPSLKAHARRVM